ncbi:sterol desaturase family protein [Polyangium mundeleinium]|uniref:Sterol desaturase family protein n=1 Tax=Polyangium mundeleinium TaxID=2995306 RepID=A0ABT5F7B3_9BACT|nr:sterol desaturase family protein [Polyangium mundeleinium]MDC0748976.1 sterol desaturase family protein [Polyangium mundeleinium]
MEVRIDVPNCNRQANEAIQRLKALKRWVWDRDISFGRAGPQVMVLAVLAAAALVAELSWHHDGLGLLELLHAKSVVIFYNVKALALSDVDAPIASWIVAAAMARIVFGILVGILDAAFYKRITGRPFDWEAMINVSVVNVVFLLTTVFTFMNPSVQRLLQHYAALIDRVPTMVHLHGALALIVACLLADFCYYWSHRWSHGNRFFWNLGHINHHRSRNLSQLTQAVDPQSSLLDVAGGRAFVIFLLPLVTKVFALDVRESGWVFIVLILLDAWTNPSHSVVLYHAENRFRVLRLFRAVLVTPAVHFTHHSREPIHNIVNGCNFGARLTLWDRLFGTYVEPPAHIPDTGLFSEEADYCRTPLRFLFQPYVRMFEELRHNKIRHWPAILFGSTAYEPPVSVNCKY